MLKSLIFGGLLVWSLTLLADNQNEFKQQAVNQQLDRLHRFAAEAKGQAYFSLFSDNAVFIGTDAGETWSIKDFKDYALAYFNQGKGWLYIPQQRHIYFSKDGKTAWFDEILKNEKYGVTRGTGVLQKYGDGWKIEQYHLTLPIPNDLAEKIVTLIKQGSKAQSK